MQSTVAAQRQYIQAASRKPNGFVLAPGPKARPGANRATFHICRALVLKPIGEGTNDHIGEEVAAPKEIVLSDGQYEIGREQPAQIVIPYPTVSSRHAILKIAGNEVNVTDLNSTNGTYIEDNELEPMETEALQVGQSVTFGDMYLAKYILEDKPEAE